MRFVIRRLLSRLRRPLKLDLDAYLLFRSHLGQLQRGSSFIENGDDGIQIAELGQESIEKVLGLITGTMNLQTVTDPGTRDIAAHAFEKRLSEGDRCFGAVVDDIFVGIRWVSFPGHSVYKSFAALVKDEPDSCVFNGAYVSPEYRGRRIQIRLDAAMKRVLGRDGLETSFSFVGVHNFASIVNCLRCHDDYRLIYHLSVDLPFSPLLNFYPKQNVELWRPCRP